MCALLRFEHNLPVYEKRGSMGWREILPFVAAQVGAQPNVSHAYHNPMMAGTLLTPRAFSPGASICFGGPDTCHDPNAIRSGVA